MDDFNLKIVKNKPNRNRHYRKLTQKEFIESYDYLMKASQIIKVIKYEP